MASGFSPILDPQLRVQMQQVGLTSFRQLAVVAQTSAWQVRQLRQGHLAQMRVGELRKLSVALHLSLETLFDWCAEPGQTRPTPLVDSKPEQPTAILQQEYARLQQELETQRDRLWHEFQHQSLYTLESWLKNWPKVVQAVQTDRPDLPLKNVLPLLRPFYKLLETWGIECIGEMQAQVPYNPQNHTLLKGQAIAGDIVLVTRPGYRQGKVLLHRAEVIVPESAVETS